MTNEQLGTLFGAFANYYWSVPLNHVIDRIAEWHPEVTAKQVQMVLNQCAKNIFRYHCCVIDEGLTEPELVAEHLVALDYDNFDRFISVRIDAPLCECDEETLLKSEDYRPDIPEIRALYEFGQAELGLDDEWQEQLIDDCIHNQPSALCDGKSWVMSVLRQEQFGKIRFETMEQVERFRELGNNLYQVLPNPVLRGWRPVDIDNAPIPPDDIPETAEEIPNSRPFIDEVLAPYGGREKFHDAFMQHLAEVAPKAKKIGPNDPCPCGSGKKYKKCCGRN